MRPVKLSAAVSAFLKADNERCAHDCEYGVTEEDAAKSLRGMFETLSIPFEDDWEAMLAEREAEYQRLRDAWVEKHPYVKMNLPQIAWNTQQRLLDTVYRRSTNRL